MKGEYFKVKTTTKVVPIDPSPPEFTEAEVETARKYVEQQLDALIDFQVRHALGYYEGLLMNVKRITDEEHT